MPENNIYYKCYYHLFDAVTEQIKKLEVLEHSTLSGEVCKHRLSEVITALKLSQCETEELFINCD